MLRGLVLFVSLTALPMFAGDVQLLPPLPNAAASYAIQLDAAGNIYLAGSFTPAVKAVHGFSSAFVAKLSSDGSKLIYSTALAGTNSDSATALAVGSDGSAYVSGNTNSTDFPVTAGAFQSTYMCRRETACSRAAPDQSPDCQGAVLAAAHFTRILGSAR